MYTYSQVVQSAVLSILLSFAVSAVLAYIAIAKNCYNKCPRFLGRYPCPYCDTMIHTTTMKTHLGSCEKHVELYSKNPPTPALAIKEPVAEAYTSVVTF